MSRRRLLLCVGAAILLGVAGIALFQWLTTPLPAVTWENFRHLREGMSVRDVKAWLGEPKLGEGRWRGIVWNGEKVLISDHDVREGRLRGIVWNGENVTICLDFVNDVLYRGEAFPLQPLGQGSIKGPVEQIAPPPEETFLARIRQWADETATYHDQRSYFAFAIAAGVLALLLWLYRRSCRLYWQSLLAKVSAVVLLGLAGFALFIFIFVEMMAVPSGESLLDRIRRWLHL